MNTGTQDVYNLAWKLALVIRGRAAAKLLETYNEERLANAQRLLETTDRMFDFVAGSNWLLSLFRTTIFPPIAGFVTNVEPIRKRFFPILSQTGINYRRARLSDHSSDASFKVKAGDRMPYFLIDGRSSHSYLHQPKFHMLIFGNGEEGIESIGQRFESEYQDIAEQQVFTLDQRVREVFGSDEPFVLLLRPDNHIGFLSQDVSLKRVERYFKEFIGA